MKIAPYWVRNVCEIEGQIYNLRAYSFRSAEDARERLEAKVRALQAFRRSSGSAEDVAALRHALRRQDELSEGEYEVVMAERIVQRVDAHNIITRNRYGAEVLNSDDTCFLDVDRFELGFMGRLMCIFGRKRSPEEALLQALRELCAADPAMGVRVYRTSRGWRLLVQTAELAPDSPHMHTLCRRLQVDEMYAGLCRKQHCWRARLTPKPSRIGMPRFPRLADSESMPAEAAAWVEQYTRQAAGVSVCRLVDTLGARIDSPIVSLHDEATGALLPDRELR